MKWKSIVKTIAPVLGTALGGPFGGMAAKAIGAAILGPESKDLPLPDLEAQIEKAIADDKNALLALKKADQEFEKEMKTLGVDIKKIDAEDRASARQMATQTTLRPQIILASIYVLAFAGILFIVFAGHVQLEGSQADMANVLLGMLSFGLAQIMNFFFGSSSGSKEKTLKLGAR